MIKTIEFIKKYWKWIVIGICGLLALILVTCSNYNYKQNQQILF